MTRQCETGVSRLLVSVRSAAEAEAALAGGADLIDVKEPTHGSLGRAAEATLTEVVRVVAGRRPVSAALGELREGTGDGLPAVLSKLAFVKWGLAGCAAAKPGWWQAELAAFGARLADTACRLVVVAYADWRRARAPSPEEVCLFAQERQSETGVSRLLLIDTWQKDGSTLLDWMSVAAVERLCARCRAVNTPIALAGALDGAALVRLRNAAPDWFAVRGAVCRAGQRSGILDAARVRQFAALMSPQR